MRRMYVGRLFYSASGSQGVPPWNPAKELVFAVSVGLKGQRTQQNEGHPASVKKYPDPLIPIIQ